jgi:hypothetical protein
MKSNRKLINVMRVLGPDVAQIKPGDVGYGAIRRKMLAGGLTFENIDQSIMNILFDSIDEHVDNAVGRAVHGANVYRDDIVRSIANNESQMLNIDEALRVGPKQFI